MTTIVADRKRGIIVADSRVTTYNHLQTYKSDKVYRAGKSVFGESGDVDAGLQFRQWAQDGFPKKGRPGALEEFYVIELAPDGMWLWDATLVRQALHEEHYAVGSGAQTALYAIRVLGKTAEEAIEEASKIDMHTALPLQSISLDK